MASKTFWELGKYKIVSDERDFMIALRLRDSVAIWCRNNNVTASIHMSAFGKDIWRVKEDEQRMWFSLRWAQ